MGGLRKLRRQSQYGRYKVERLQPQDTVFLCRKLSEVLLDFAEPLLNEADESDSSSIINFAALCWNLSFFPPGDRQRNIETIAGKLGKKPSSSYLELENLIQKMVDRKTSLFAQDRRFIVNIKIVNERRGAERLLVMSTLVKDDNLADIAKVSAFNF